MKLNPEAIAESRQKHPEAQNLSDWQVHSANLTAQAISSVAKGEQQGPVYVPFPTGSGKSLGAVWGIVELAQNCPDLRIALLVPYIDSVDSMSKNLADKLDRDTVGYYYRDAPISSKEEELKKRVVVVTHQFLPHNKNALDDRDLFVVDEAIYATDEASLKLSDFDQARDWATTNNIYPEEFTALADLAHDADRELRDKDLNFLPIEPDAIADQILTLAVELDLDDHIQRIENLKQLTAIRVFCEACAGRLAFLAKGQQNKQSYSPVLSGAVFDIPKMDKTVILSATGGALYGIADRFKPDKGSQEHWTPPSYRNLNLVKLAGPSINGQYRSWGNDQTRDVVTTYVDWLLKEIPEEKVYLTMPKQVIEQCLKAYLGLPSSGEVTYPVQTTIHGKTVFVSNHARSVGSNEFRDCGAVLYLWDNHVPQVLAVQRYHTLVDEDVTYAALEDAKGVLMGNYQKVRDAQYIDNMMQHIGRGSVRKIDAEANVGAMSAYIFTEKGSRFDTLATNYMECQITKMAYEGVEVKHTSARVPRIINYLQQHGNGRVVTAKEITDAIGANPNDHKEELEFGPELNNIGYRFVRGGRGRGNSAKFIPLGQNVDAAT